ncbi:hypothetical protein LAZ67_20001423 [Cordylochernes scorpioides]|uniref:Histone-lysine N-methyltransferase SETMAR n=1 Tax=Cordylochernes scorpioides TaxID=51811 RepID=A0ABY6LJX0_9ARAC|nr:hypothetical protein LAZ67_20001423 [Cordylochernes scorpioides]
MMPQPPYSPDLAPCDFFLFPKLKRPMKGRRYATLDEMKTASKEELKKIFKNDFLKCFEDWKKPLAQTEPSLNELNESTFSLNQHNLLVKLFYLYHSCSLSQHPFPEHVDLVDPRVESILRINPRLEQREFYHIK